jgi:hypothetical protein
MADKKKHSDDYTKRTDLIFSPDDSGYYWQCFCSECRGDTVSIIYDHRGEALNAGLMGTIEWQAEEQQPSPAPESGDAPVVGTVDRYAQEQANIEHEEYTRDALSLTFGF